MNMKRTDKIKYSVNMFFVIFMRFAHNFAPIIQIDG